MKSIRRLHPTLVVMSPESASVRMVTTVLIRIDGRLRPITTRYQRRS